MNSALRNEEYIIDGNKAVNFKLIRTADDLLDNSSVFEPDMCHQIFGEKQLIYGYKNLTIKLYYSAAWLRIYCGIEFTEKLDDVEPSDLLRKISKIYEMPLIENIEVFRQLLDEEKNFTPFGQLWYSFNSSTDNDDFFCEIHVCDNETPGFRDYHNRLQTFLLWFIDGVSFIDINDSAWKFFVVYQMYRSQNRLRYAFIGIITVYEYYAYPNLKRPRISQVFVLPPFQRRGIGAKLLNAVYDYYTSNPTVLDITVEDPSEDFQKVRDFVDCVRIIISPKYDAGMLCKEKRNDFISLLHTTLKINKRQARRVYEILRMMNLPENDNNKFIEFRLEVKGRLNQPFQKQNKILQKCGNSLTDQDIQDNFLSDEDRKAKLELMFNELLDVYSSVIDRLRPVCIRAMRKEDPFVPF